MKPALPLVPAARDALLPFPYQPRIHQARPRQPWPLQGRRWPAPLYGLLLAALGLQLAAALPARAATAAAPAAALATVEVGRSGASGRYVAEATVEAVREARVAAQVQGRIVELAVQAGDRVSAGQLLLRIDPSVAAEQLAASRAQQAQAQALLVSARGDLERARRLHAQAYLSAAALEKAQAQFDAAQAQAAALRAQAQATGAQAGFYTLRAPFAGWVSRVEVSVGDLAAPGRLLLTMYDPRELRVSGTVPESVLAGIDRQAPAEVLLPGSGLRLRAGALEVLPGLDAATHSATVRVRVQAEGAPGVVGAAGAEAVSGPAASAGAGLPVEPGTLQPGRFARISLALKPPVADARGGGVAQAVGAQARAGGAAPSAPRISVPLQAVVRRGELNAVYVVKAAGQASLRQVRLGRENGDQVEVLAGLMPGERVALDPVAAARAGQP